MRNCVAVEEFSVILSEICNKETSLDPSGWTKDNPLWGHCAVVALLAQDVFGGTLLRASLEGTEFEDMRSHYWNQLENGSEVDFTEQQFKGRRPIDLDAETRTREYVLSNPETAERYKALALRFCEKVF